MDPRLIRLYQDELTHLRELGREFAHEHPKIASRLGMEGMEVADPYVALPSSPHEFSSSWRPNSPA